MTTRREHRRRELAARKGRLSIEDSHRLNENRRLPEDHPSYATEEPGGTSAAVAWRFLDTIQRSGVVPDLQQRETDSSSKAEVTLWGAILEIRDKNLA